MKQPVSPARKPPGLGRAILLAAGLAYAFGSAERPAAARPDGELTLRVVDAGSGRPVPARLHLMDARGRPVRARGLGVAPHADHFYLPGELLLGLRRGAYTFRLDPGAERPTHTGHFEIRRRAQDSKTITTQRSADLASEGWHGADLDADRPPRGLDVALAAEGLAYTPLAAWRSDRAAWRRAAGRDATNPPPANGADAAPLGVAPHAARLRTAGGSLLFFRHDSPIDPAELPPPAGATVAHLRAARAAGYRVVAADLAAWDLPLWLAAGVLDAGCVIDGATLATEPRDRPRGAGDAGARRVPPRVMYPGARGAGRWREAIYLHVLGAGLRLPAVAGSGTGRNDSPLGAGRVYAAAGRAPTAERWWQAVSAGATFVTTGPLLRPAVEGQPPGHTFGLDAGGRFEAHIALSLSTRARVEYLEIIQNGEVLHTVPLRDWAAAGGRLPPLSFDGPGWFALRASTTSASRYDYALSGAYFVGLGERPRISRASCRFFLDWLDEQERSGPPAAAAADRQQARTFWRSRLSEANAP